MEVDIIIREQIRNFQVLGSSFQLNCNGMELSMLNLFFYNLNTFGRYYWDSYITNCNLSEMSDIDNKISQISPYIDSNIDIYEETVIKQRKRDYKMNGILD